MNRINDVVFLNDNKAELEVIDLNNEYHYFIVNEDDYYDYRDGKLIQEAFPYLSIDEREIIISGMTPDMWDETFNNINEY